MNKLFNSLEDLLMQREGSESIVAFSSDLSTFSSTKLLEEIMIRDLASVMLARTCRRIVSLKFSKR